SRETLKNSALSFELESPPSANLAICLAFFSSSLRSCISLLARSAFSDRSKYFLPSIQVCTQTVPESNGDLDQIARSASLPGSSEPTYLSIRNCWAGLSVTNFSASISGVPPYLTALAASR